jgi:ABC-type transport system, involved in lipoprotein release, permease component
MGKSFLLARSNLRKAKGQTTAIIVLIFLAALMLNLWLWLSMDYRENFERCHDRLNAEHVTFAIGGDNGEVQDFMEDTLEADERTAEYFMDSVLHMTGTFEYNGGEMTSQLIFMEKEAALSRPVGRMEIVEDSDYTSGVYMPNLYRSKDIAVGKTIEISIGNKKMSYTVCGFFNSAMAGSHNCGMCGILMTKDSYQELKEAGLAIPTMLCSIRLEDKSESEDYDAMLKDAVSSRFSAVGTVSNTYDMVSRSRYISQMICSGIMSAMACLLLLIALVVIASNIINYIQENMKNLGALKAAGYTSRQLVASLLLQFTGITLAVALLGAGISYALFPYINELMVLQTGIPYEIHFLPVPFLLTLAVLGGTVSLVVCLSSRRIRKVEPIVALRQGIKTHTFKKNHIPLERTRAGLNLALALKTTLSGMKHNVTVCITMLVLSLVAVFSGVMIENMITDMTPFLNMIVGETADSCINVTVDAEKEFLDKMNGDDRVEKVYLYHSVQMLHVGGDVLMVTITDDFSVVNNQDVMIEGRFPKYDNEMAIAAKYAEEMELEIGDEIELTADGIQGGYIISGFVQITNNLGKDCLLTRDGYERLGKLQDTSYYLNLTDGTDIGLFNKEMEEIFGDKVTITIDIDATVESAAHIYVLLMKMIVLAVLVLSVVVITFVLYLLVRTIVSNKKQEYGILKALGFTTGQLILQTALSFMPAVILSTVVGVTVCSFIINPLTVLFLKDIGIVKCTFRVPAGYNVLAGMGMIVAAFVIVCLLSMKIKKITPRALLTGE